MSENNSKKTIANPNPSSEAAHNRMKAVKSKNTAPEKAVRSALHRMGLSFRVDERPIKDLNRKADILFRSVMVAVFIDGCFWHGCPIHGTKSKTNAEFWEQKIKRNKERDRDTDKRLKAEGWKVIRIWEHEDSEQAAQKIYKIIVNYRKNQ